VIAWQALLQFPLVYLPCTVIGLTVYGVNFTTPAGIVCVAGVAAMIALHLVWESRPVERAFPYIVFYVGGLVGVLAYRGLHVRYWDEQSVTRAALVSVVGLFSLAASKAGAAALRSHTEGSSNAARGLWAGLGLAVLCPFYFFARFYPLMPYLWSAMVVTFAAGLTCADTSKPASGAGRDRRWSATVPGTILFFLGLDLSQVIYDYGVVTLWAPHLAIVMLGASVGIVVRGRTSAKPVTATILSAGMASYVTSVLHTGFVLNYAHSTAGGLVLGWTMGEILFGSDPGTALRRLAGRFGAVLAAGMVVSYWIAQNLALNWLRVLLPAAVVVFWFWRTAPKDRRQDANRS